MDIDPQAITATKSNAARNDVADRLSVHDYAASVHGTFDVVVANILADPIIGHAEAITAHVGHGCLLALSGMIAV